MALTTGAPRATWRANLNDSEYLSATRTIVHRVENLAAGADFTQRAIFRCPFPVELVEAIVLPEANSAGVDGSNTVVVDVTNITGSVTMATVTSTTNYAANTPVTIAITAANRYGAGDDVIGLAVTQGATADTNGFTVQLTFAIRTLVG